MERSRRKATAYLTQIYGEASNRKFKLMCSKITIGRSFHADIRLKNPNISRNHCTLYYNEKGGWSVTDNKSQNGTYVSGRKLKSCESRPLQCGDIIFLGPPSEMPEAFCYDDAFVDDDDIINTGHEIIELPPAKRFVEEKMTVSKKKSLINKNSDVEPVKIISPCATDRFIMETDLVSHFIEVSNSSEHKMHNKVLLPQKNENLSPIQSVKNCESSSQLNEINAFNQSSDLSSMDVLSAKSQINDIDTVSKTSHLLSVDIPSSKKLKVNNSDIENQINEISSTGDDQIQDSLSLLEVEKNNIVGSSCSSFNEDKKNSMNTQNSQTFSEVDFLKSKLALLTDQMKKIEQSKLNLLKNYEVVCEKNFALDRQLSEKRKIEEDLKNCEVKVQKQIKNELLEKFEEDLICNICTELLIKPTVLDCSHTFCLYCIKEWKKKKNECPICRRKILTMTPVLTLEHFIDKTLSTLTPEQKEKRNQLIKERENPPKKPVTPTTSRRRRNSRRRFRNPTRSLASTNNLLASRNIINNDIEIIAERSSNIISYPFEHRPISVLIPGFRIPHVLMDSQ